MLLSTITAISAVAVAWSEADARWKGRVLPPPLWYRNLERYNKKSTIASIQFPTYWTTYDYSYLATVDGHFRIVALYVPTTI